MEAVRTADRDRYLSALYAPDGPAAIAVRALCLQCRDRLGARPHPRSAARRNPPAMVARRHRQRRARRPSARRGAACGDRPSQPAARKPFDDYLEARIFDLYDDPMPGRAELEGYCGETASALIQLAALVLDTRSRTRCRRSRGPCGLRAGDRRADPADPAASRARPMLRAARRACRGRDDARGIRRRRGQRLGPSRGHGDGRACGRASRGVRGARRGHSPIAAPGIPAACPDRRLSRRDHPGRRRSADQDDRHLGDPAALADVSSGVEGVACACAVTVE